MSGSKYEPLAVGEIYESEKLLSEYLLFHFGAEDEILPSSQVWPAGMREALGFPCRTVAHFSQEPVARGLDLGCAVGRSAFEMAKTCKTVLGIDFSHAFIDAAKRLSAGERISYFRREEAAEITALEACAPAGLDLSRLSFRQGDAMNLPADLIGFERVHAANLLCRLPDPEKLLVRLPDLVCSGGELILATPCTWLEEFTPPEHWPVGGTQAWLKAKLGASFHLVSQVDEPFLIRETARKFQWTRSWLSVWRRH
jgi:putative 4-mercaptohistidine N1-methyltranferase